MRLLFAIILGVSLTSLSYGQDVRTISFNDLFQDLGAVEQGKDLVVTQNGRALTDYTLVSIPANTLKPRYFVQLTADHNSSLNMVSMYGTRNVPVDYSGITITREGVVRIAYFCDSPQQDVCEKKLADILAQDTVPQSTGAVTMMEGEKMKWVFGLIYSSIHKK